MKPILVCMPAEDHAASVIGDGYLDISGGLANAKKTANGDRPIISDTGKTAEVMS